MMKNRKETDSGRGGLTGSSGACALQSWTAAHTAEVAAGVTGRTVRKA